MRLQLHGLATILRTIALPEAMATWSLTSLQLKLVKISVRVVRHAYATTFQLAEVAAQGKNEACFQTDPAKLERLGPCICRPKPQRLINQ